MKARHRGARHRVEELLRQTVSLPGIALFRGFSQWLERRSSCWATECQGESGTLLLFLLLKAPGLQMAYRHKGGMHRSLEAPGPETAPCHKGGMYLNLEAPGPQMVYRHKGGMHWSLWKASPDWFKWFLPPGHLGQSPFKLPARGTGFLKWFLTVQSHFY